MHDVVSLFIIFPRSRKTTQKLPADCRLCRILSLSGLNLFQSGLFHEYCRRAVAGTQLARARDLSSVDRVTAYKSNKNTLLVCVGQVAPALKELEFCAILEAYWPSQTGHMFLFAKCLIWSIRCDEIGRFCARVDQEYPVCGTILTPIVADSPLTHGRCHSFAFQHAGLHRSGSSPALHRG